MGNSSNRVKVMCVDLKSSYSGKSEETLETGTLLYCAHGLNSCVQI